MRRRERGWVLFWFIYVVVMEELGGLVKYVMLCYAMLCICREEDVGWLGGFWGGLGLFFVLGMGMKMDWMHGCMVDG